MNHPSAPAGLDVHLTFLSDWHVGTGAGRVGAIDACVHRDHDGLPFVPAKTLTGVWRDACETVAQALDGAPKGPWSDWVTTLFGGHEKDPAAPAMLALGPARLPEDVAEALRAHPALREAVYVRRPGVAIDPATGTAREDFLRLEERVTAGLTLSTRVEALRLAPGTPFPDEAELLLRAGARLVDALGGKRSRGAGRVSLQIETTPPPDSDPSEDRLRQLLDDETLLASPASPPPLFLATTDLGPGRLAETAQRHGPGRTVHRITLRVRTPVVVPDRLRGNLLTTHDRVLGTGLLPAILERIPRRLGLADIQITDAVPAALVDGRYVPAHPAPLVWHRADKGEGSVMFNLAAKAAPPTAKAKPAKSRIVKRADGTWVAVRPGVTDRTHAVIDDEARRPVESAGGGLFTFQGIPAGTVLVTDVVLPGGVGLDLPAGHLLRLGRSRKDDFGLVEVLSVDVHAEPAPGIPAPRPDGSRRLTVWCLSDVLLCSATLAPDPTPEGLAAALATALTEDDAAVDGGGPTGVTGPVRLAVVRAPEGDDRRPTATAATRREGFAVRWGRPRPSQVALAAGSVVTFEVTSGSVTAEALARVERDGIGDRRAEGFGRVRFNLPDLGQETLELVRERSSGPRGQVPLPPTTAPSGVPDAVRTTVHHIIRTAWRTAIRRRVEELAASSNLLDLLLPGSRPTDSQLGGLRAQLGRNPRDVRDWFAGLRASQNRSDSWKPSAIDAAEAFLLDDGPPAVAALASRPPTVWQILGMASGWDAEGDRSDGTPSAEVLRLREEMTAEARALLLVAMHRQPRGDSASLTEPAGELTEPARKDNR